MVFDEFSEGIVFRIDVGREAKIGKEVPMPGEKRRAKSEVGLRADS